jgi:hypothetical protein
MAFGKACLVEGAVLVRVGGVVAVGNDYVVVLVSWCDIQLLEIFEVELFAEGLGALI